MSNGKVGNGGLGGVKLVSADATVGAETTSLRGDKARRNASKLRSGGLHFVEPLCGMGGGFGVEIDLRRSPEITFFTMNLRA